MTNDIVPSTIASDARRALAFFLVAFHYRKEVFACLALGCFSAIIRVDPVRCFSVFRFSLNVVRHSFPRSVLGHAPDPRIVCLVCGATQDERNVAGDLYFVHEADNLRVISFTMLLAVSNSGLTNRLANRLECIGFGCEQ